MPRAAETASERQARLAEIRRQIRAGTYETRERLSAAVGAILEDFAGQPDDASGDLAPESDESPSRGPRPK
jgi:hypothetical protein